MALDPIEKKPLRRFHPGSQILSIGSMGCNLRCPFCQNYEISMQEDAAFCVRLQPQEIVAVSYTHLDVYKRQVQQAVSGG